MDSDLVSTATKWFFPLSQGIQKVQSHLPQICERVVDWVLELFIVFVWGCTQYTRETESQAKVVQTFSNANRINSADFFTR